MLACSFFVIMCEMLFLVILLTALATFTVEPVHCAHLESVDAVSNSENFLPRDYAMEFFVVAFLEFVNLNVIIKTLVYDILIFCIREVLAEEILV